MAIRDVPATRSHHVIFLRTPVALVRRIDDFARANNITTRTRAVFKLLQAGLHQWELSHHAAKRQLP